jgi:hypothetical protein
MGRHVHEDPDDRSVALQLAQVIDGALTELRRYVGNEPAALAQLQLATSALTRLARLAERLEKRTARWQLSSADVHARRAGEDL